MNQNQAKSTPTNRAKTTAVRMAKASAASTAMIHAARTTKTPAVHTAEAQAEAEHRAWLAKYLPVEQKILAERERMFERRAELRAERRARRTREFGDICEWTEGAAARWWRDGFAPLETMFLEFFRDAGYYMYLDYMRRWSTQRIDKARSALRRPLYYARENERRRALAAARRKIDRRHTENPCPTKEDILEAWLHAKDSHEAAIRFGGMLEDLECYIDNSLLRNEYGEIAGRCPGIKGWLKDNIPALYLKYTTVMRYKAAAKKLRQIAGISDPTPVSAIVPRREDEVPSRHDAGSEAKATVQETGSKAENPEPGSKLQGKASGNKVRNRGGMPSLEIVKAMAIWREISGSAAGSATALMARIDALTDPEAVEDANMLREWRERYECEITVRTKSRWWRRLVKMLGEKCGEDRQCAAKGAG